jgi:hypothetical protein
LEGTLWVERLCRKKWKTMMILAKEVIINKIDGARLKIVIKNNNCNVGTISLGVLPLSTPMEIFGIAFCAQAESAVIKLKMKITRNIFISLFFLHLDTFFKSILSRL